MIRLHFTVEGQTEEQFVNRMLVPHLASFDVFGDARRVLTSENVKSAKEYRGGFRRTAAYEVVKRDILNWMKEDDHPECRFTTMFDLYALPNSFPGYDETPRDLYGRIGALEAAFKDDIDAAFGGFSRFVPYIQLHEFEAFLFVDPLALDREYLEHDSAIRNLMEVVEKESNPEAIDDGRETAPSKRIKKEIPEYDKNAAGVNVVEHIGLEGLRQKCRHFHQWMERLENLGR